MHELAYSLYPGDHEVRTSRRSLIKLGLLATASYVTFFEGLSARPASAAQPITDDGAWLRRDMFEACLNESFVLNTGSGAITLRLKRVDDVPSARTAGTVDHDHCFTLVFAGPRGSRLPQDTYRVENNTLGAFALFLVPGPVSSTASTFVATFNRVTN